MASLASCATAGISALCTLHSLSPYYSSQTHTHTQNVTTKLEANNSPPPSPRPALSLLPIRLFSFTVQFFLPTNITPSGGVLTTPCYLTQLTPLGGHINKLLFRSLNSIPLLPPLPHKPITSLNKLLQALNIFPL